MVLKRTDFQRSQCIGFFPDQWNKWCVAIVNLVFKSQLRTLNVFGHKKTKTGLFFSWSVLLLIRERKEG